MKYCIDVKIYVIQIDANIEPFSISKIWKNIQNIAEMNKKLIEENII